MLGFIQCRVVKRPTQADVARIAGVSRATVSYVLNEPDNITISPETRERVLEAIQSLGYEPDTRAQSLRSGDSKTVGILIPDIHNPHFWQVVEGVEEEASKAGYDLLLAQSSSSQSKEDYALQALSRRTISGLIVIKSMVDLHPATLKRLKASKRPIVEYREEAAQFDCIVTNYRQGTHELMSYLLELGHRRFAFVNGVSGPGVGADRLDVFKQMLQAAGLPFQVEACGITTEDGYRVAHKILSQTVRPTALVVINDLLAYGVLRAAADVGLRVPEDVSVASFDDLPVSSYFIPRLTTVQRDTRADGRAALRLLLERQAQPDLPLRAVKMPTKFIVRESTGPVSEG